MRRGEPAGYTDAGKPCSARAMLLARAALRLRGRGSARRATIGMGLMLRRFFSYYRPWRRLFLLDFSCAVLAGLLELGFPMAVRAFVDRLLPGRDWTIILLAAAGLLAIYLLNTGLQAIV